MFIYEQALLKRGVCLTLFLLSFTLMTAEWSFKWQNSLLTSGNRNFVPLVGKIVDVSKCQPKNDQVIGDSTWSRHRAAQVVVYVACEALSKPHFPTQLLTTMRSYVNTHLYLQRKTCFFLHPGPLPYWHFYIWTAIATVVNPGQAQLLRSAVE